MKIKSGTEEQYDRYKTVNSTDAYSARVVSYAEDWANLMEARMAKGERIADIAKPTSSDADTDGITGYMYGAAVAGLARFWEHGEALRLWHNLATQLRDEGKRANDSGGVLNPAILNIASKI